MAKRTPIVVLVVVAAIALGGCCSASKADMTSSQSVNLRPQETNNWCWAATTEMIAETMGVSLDQCDLANDRFGRTDCCEGSCPKNDDCNMPGWTMFTETGATYDSSSTPLSWNALKEEIYCDGKPMAYAYGPKSGGVGHVLVIYGYAELGSSGSMRYLFLKDPWSPCNGQDRSITYDEYSNSGTTDHWETMHNITYP
jgi:hypothetical protein